IEHWRLMTLIALITPPAPPPATVSNQLETPLKPAVPVARLLDRIVQLALVLRTHTRYPARHDLRAFGNELRKQFHIFVVDGIDAFDAELTKLLPAVILFLSRRSFFSG